jgi:hypothetical protein
MNKPSGIDHMSFPENIIDRNPHQDDPDGYGRFHRPLQIG